MFRTKRATDKRRKSFAGTVADDAQHVPEAAMFFYVNNDEISTRLHDWSTGGLLLVCPLVVSFVRQIPHVRHGQLVGDLLRGS